MKYIFIIGYLIVVVGLVVMTIGSNYKVEQAQSNWNFNDSTTIRFTYIDDKGIQWTRYYTGKEYTDKLSK